VEPSQADQGGPHRENSPSTSSGPAHEVHRILDAAT